MKSYQTTIAGVLAAVLVIGQQVLFAIDSDPETNFNLTIVAAQLAILYGFVKARDNNKSSEDVGAK